MILLCWLLWLLLFCQFLFTLSRKSANLLFPWVCAIVSQSLLYSIPMEDQQTLWLISLSWVVLSGYRSWGQVGFRTSFARSSLTLHWGTWEIYKTMPLVNGYTIVSLEVQSDNWPCQYLFYDKMLSKCVIFKIDIGFLGVTIANGFSDWPFASFLWKLGRSLTLKVVFGGWCSSLSNSFWPTAAKKALESTRMSIVRLFLKFRGT